MLADAILQQRAQNVARHGILQRFSVDTAGH